MLKDLRLLRVIEEVKMGYGIMKAERTEVIFPEQDYNQKWQKK